MITIPAVSDSSVAHFSHDATPMRSPRYVPVNTGAVHKVFTDSGLSLRTVVAQKLNSKSRANGKEGLQRHIFRFDTGIILPDNSRLEVLARNSYDGTTAFGLSLGVFRIVCSNGLIAGTSFLRLNVPHSGSTVWTRVEDGIKRILTEGPRMADTIARWQSRTLPDPMRFASRVAASLLPAGATVMNPERLLNLRRPEDQNADLWTMFNRVQENAMAGGLHYRLATDDAGKVRHTRRMRGAEAVFKANSAMWDLANETEAEIAV